MDIKDVENLARLARIDLTDEEKQAMLKDMKSILDYVDQIEKVKLPDTRSEHDLRNIWRVDEALPREFDRELIVGQFPDSKPARPDGRSGGDGYLKVKKIL